jgi:hypothetical protein
VPLKAIDEIQGIFADGVPKKRSPEEKKLEDKFKLDNFDLITWFVISE